MGSLPNCIGSHGGAQTLEAELDQAWTINQAQAQLVEKLTESSTKTDID